MKRSIAILSLILLVAGVTTAAAGEYTVGFFADYEATSCEIYNTTPEIITIHMLLYGDAATANLVTFYAPTPQCWDAVWLGDEIADGYLFLGSTHSLEFGLSVHFVGCEDLSARIGSMSFFASGSDACCKYDAFGAPPSVTGQVEAITCGVPVGSAVVADVESVTINPNAGCSCTASSVVAVEETTWGQIKSLYQ